MAFSNKVPFGDVLCCVLVVVCTVQGLGDRVEDFVEGRGEPETIVGDGFGKSAGACCDCLVLCL